MRCEHVIDVAAPPERVYEVIADVRRWPEFMSALERVRVLDANGGVVRVEMHEAAGRVRDAAVYDVAFDAPRRMRADQAHGFFRSCTVVWTLGASGAGTRVVVEHEFRTGWPLVGAVLDRAIVAPRLLHPIVERSLANFKALVETGRSPKRAAG